ncbi:T9SS type A sorting domain-containing protein [Chitinophaga tropicalis]|uniref:T9SS type A sorting domain-containing protein n=1 Tax=Chitinophaga tropicalis TaxID=2683588 RepID=A0A7K1UCH8_9BACT|nr:T9SS type A sorting domain-containing protein [Chitinophaga tropicalis]MVT12082.1 T9SS type A sorting domain-containing protein [Chitinophaga tropicalis]
MKTKLLALFKQKVMLLFVFGSFISPHLFPQFRQKKLAFLCLLLVSIVFLGYKAEAQNTGYTWKNAPIGGGGFVTGIVTHKTSGDRYCRTDVGGAYRWDATNNKWVQLLDWLNESENGFIGVEALALDPQNPNNVYMLCGTSYINNGRTAILKSTDKGNTFTYTDVTDKFKAHGNGSGRGNGERLAVDPKNSNILFCGTRANGLWKSTDGGVTWNLAWNGVTTTPNENGICFVLYDPSGAVVNGASQTIYIGVSRTGSENIYKSTDGGATFTAISATTGFMPHRAALQGTTMYVTYSDEAGPQSGGGDGKLYKLNTTTGVWTNVTPAHWKDYSYGGVSIDPTNVDRVIVSTCGLYWNNQFGTGWGDFIFLSADGGSTWTLKNGTNATYDSNGMEWSAGGGVNWMDCIEFDQSNLSKVRVIGGGGIYTCSDITATNPSWKYDVIGIEETALLDGISIPGGPFISSFGDVTGFVHEPLTSYPSKRLSPTDGNNQSIAYAAGNTNKVVRASNGGNIVYYSTDKGATWTGTPTNMGSQGKVAISADGGTILHCPGGSATTYYTTNNGSSWTACSGVSLGDAAPVADQVNPNYFYIYNPGNGQMLRSSNKGVSFSVAGTPGASTANYPWESAQIRTAPGLEGHVWVPLGRNGLKYSSNYGAAYTTVSDVTYCKTVGMGKAMSGSSYPTVFIWGTVSGVTGLFRSTDQGATWTRINDDANEFAGAPLLVGDMNVAGRVYMSAGGGRGLIYWDPAPCTPTAITPYVQLNGGTWQQTANASVSAGGSVQFGPQPIQGGSWSWSGPNNFSAATREVTISNIQANQAGNYVATYTNSGGCQSTQTFNITLTGSILRESWTGIGGTVIGSLTSNASYPNNPTGRDQITSLEGPTNWADNYGTRIRGYIHPPVSGSYTFWIAGDDNADLYLSTTDNPANSSRIAYVNGWTTSRQWNKYSTQQSAAISLVAGQKYYIEVLHKEGGGGDNVAVSWQGPGISQQVIAGSYLSPLVLEAGTASAARVSSKVSINENAVSIYPNPSIEGRFTVLLQDISESAVVRIYDNQGRMLYEKKTYGSNKIEIDSRLNAGFYIVTIDSKGESFTKKLIVH